MNKADSILNKRRAGVLLHITSLPGSYEQGDMGKDAYHFIDFLKHSGVSVWQTLPLGMPHEDGSPYQCLSAHAGNPALISIEDLLEKGWLEKSELPEGKAKNNEYRKLCLQSCFLHFRQRATKQDIDEFEQFCRKSAWWLDDFALFQALKREFLQEGWYDWPVRFKNRDKKSLKGLGRLFPDVIESIKFKQFLFFSQWHELRGYAHSQGVYLFGDIPIFVAYDSADVWAQRKNFKLNDSGTMAVVAGVPPDYFSAVGQRWGNPHYDWDYMRDDGFKWWLERMQTQLEIFDIIRIDHFRGLEAAWEIPAEEETAVKGEWVAAPGEALLEKINQHFGFIPLVAEDLGIITPEVEELRDWFNLPGMKILHFAFDGGTDNPYLPHNHVTNCVVYTGTHDNDTTLGWYYSLSEQEQRQVYACLGHPQMSMPGALVHAAMASVANLVIVPMQDILKLGAEHRMNIPGTMEGNWRWRFQWDQLSDEKAKEFADVVALFGREATL